MRCRVFVCGDGCWFAICKAHVYKQHRLQVAYIQEYFLVRANVVKAELCQLQQLFGSSDAAVLPRGWWATYPMADFFLTHLEAGKALQRSVRIFCGLKVLFPKVETWCGMMRNWTGMTVLFYNNCIGDDPNSILVRQEHRQSERAMTHDSFSSLSLSLSHRHNSITPSPISLTEKMRTCR